MRILFDSEIPSFLKAASPLLNSNPTTHSFILSLTEKFHAQGKSAALLVRGISPTGQTEIAGIQTDTARPILLSKSSEHIAEAFADALQSCVESLPGVNGPLPTVDAFASAWAGSKLCSTKTITNLRLFLLDSVTHPSLPLGSWREATHQDEDLLVQWKLEFIEEAVPHDPKPPLDELRQVIRDGIAKRHYYFWIDNKPVCLVGSTRETDAGRWIAPVYTPPHFRGKGYASALVAKVSQQFVDAGKKCLLFTDLANPTSNSIYQKLGYKPLDDFKHIDFVNH